MGVIDTAARQDIAALRARIARIEGREPEVPPAGMAVILDEVAREWDVQRELLRGDSRHAELITPRWVAMLLAQQLLRQSLPRIGRTMRRDHTSVLHGIRRIRARIAADPDFAARLDALAARITANQQGDIA